MKNRILLSASLVTAVLALPNPLLAAENEAAPMPWGQIKLDARFRWENVEQKGVPEVADAKTLRTRLTYLSPTRAGFSGGLEIENVSVLGAASFNDTLNGKTGFPVVPDPSDTLVNRAFLQYTFPTRQKLIVGRQTLAFENQRFVGTGGWRQNDQTFDAVTFEGAISKALSVKVARVYQINRTVGTRSPAGTWDDTDINLANLSWTISPTIKASGYYYRLEIPDAPAQSSSTTGVRLELRHKLGAATTLSLVADGARQKSLSGAARAYELPYYSFEPAISRGPWTVNYLIESVGGDGRSGLQFALGSNHLFNGWADKFLTTPANGLIDHALTLQYSPPLAAKGLASVRATLSYHTFDAYKGHVHYGTEWNTLLEKDFNAHVTVGLKLADYSADTFATDTRKVMPYVQLKY